MKKIIKLIFFKIFLIIFLLINFSIANEEISIELQVADEIITNVDFIKEQNYLVALNNNLKDIPKNQLEKLSRESLIREKIKKMNYQNFIILIK